VTGELAVRHLGDDRFAIQIRDHTITVDQPLEEGGEDTAPTPTELFIGGLAACVAFYGRRYCARHDIDPDGLAVRASFAVGGRPARVTAIDLEITPPAQLPGDRRDGFLAVSSHCTVHNTLSDAPAPRITLEERDSTSS
jgi:uncharacterized OsmC-like protein